METWRDLLEEGGGASVVLPWTGGRALHAQTQTFRLVDLPQNFGWYRFQVRGRKAFQPHLVEPETGLLQHIVVGYLVGDRMVPDQVYVDSNPVNIVQHSEAVYLIPETLERFSRVRAGRIYSEGPLIFMDVDFPLGPEEDVLNAYLDRKDEVMSIPGVVPALDAAFRMEIFQREQTEIRRRHLEEIRIQEEAQREQARKRQEMLEKMGSGAGRRAVAQFNFQEAAAAALAVGDALYLDHRVFQVEEWLVKYSVDGRRLECVCDTNLRIIDAGICLTDHHSGEQGDKHLTLESLPSTVRQAVRENKLVVYRHG